MKREIILKILLGAGIFWILDFALHVHGVGETNYYYTLKLVNSLIFSFMWFRVYNNRGHLAKLIFSAIFGTWVSLSYLITSYSGFVQFFGLAARSTPPPFVVFGVFLSPFLWWIFHILALYVGLEVASKLFNKKRK